MADRTVNPVPKPPRTFADTKPVSERKPQPGEKSDKEQRVNLKQGICSESKSKQTAAAETREASTIKEETSPAVQNYTTKMIRFFETQ